MKKYVLFVCLGNICRSPMAEGVLRKIAAERGIDLEVDSAATSPWHVGNPPDGRATVACRLAGYEISNIVARHIEPADFNRADLIVAMDHSNLMHLDRYRPDGVNTPTRLLTEFLASEDHSEIPDPYYSGKFESTLKLIEAGCNGLLDYLATAEQ